MRFQLVSDLKTSDAARILATIQLSRALRRPSGFVNGKSGISAPALMARITNDQFVECVAPR
jgi:hypothetical protein